MLLNPQLHTERWLSSLTGTLIVEKNLRRLRGRSARLPTIGAKMTPMRSVRFEGGLLRVRGSRLTSYDLRGTPKTEIEPKHTTFANGPYNHCGATKRGRTV